MSQPSYDTRQTVEDALAGRVEASRGAASPLVAGLHEWGAIDRAVYRAVADTPTPLLDGPLRQLSRAADRSRLWLGIATAIAAVGGGRGRRVAVEGMLAIGVTSATVNLGWKPLARRRRPESTAAVIARRLPMPESRSFPSGHAASAFAFAYAVSRHLPGMAVPIRVLAGAVAYSRVHTGVHYPGDVVIGSILGAGTATMVAAVWDRLGNRPPAR